MYCLSLFFIQGGDVISEPDTQKTRIYLLQWLKSDRALLMLFNDGTFQVILWSSLFITKQIDFKWIVHPKITILSSFG